MEATLVFTTIPEIQFMLLLMPDVGFESVRMRGRRLAFIKYKKEGNAWILLL